MEVEDGDEDEDEGFFLVIWVGRRAGGGFWLFGWGEESGGLNVGEGRKGEVEEC